LAAHFAKRNTKFGGGGKRGRVKIPGGRPLSNPLPFCPPERKLSKVSVGIFAEKSSDFGQERQHYTIFSFFHLVLRLAASRLGAVWGQISETFFALRAKKILTIKGINI